MLWIMFRHLGRGAWDAADIIILSCQCLDHEVLHSNKIVKIRMAGGITMTLIVTMTTEIEIAGKNGEQEEQE